MSKAKHPEQPAPDAAEPTGPATVSAAMAVVQAARIAEGKPAFLNGEELEAEARLQFPDLLNP